MKKVLQEVMMRDSLKLDESVKVQKKGCLGTLKGPCADFINPTRNNNLYGRKLWENVFNDDIVKESLEDHILIGELDHPLDGRLESLAKEACIVMTDYEFDDNKGLLLGTFDILDTERGQCLKKLLDYGCKIGVSSRGEGEVTQKEGVDVVDENSFTFVAFDAVVLPAVRSAKPSLQESVKYESLKESLKKEIDAAKTPAELDTIKKVVENTSMPEVDSLLESINNKSKELEGTTSSSNLVEDLEVMTKKVDELTAENRSLKSSVTTSKEELANKDNDLKKLMTESESRQKSFDNLNGKYERLMKKMNLRGDEINKLTEENSLLNSQVGDLKESLSSLRTSVREGKKDAFRLSHKIECNEKELSRKDEKIKGLTSEIESLKEDLSRKTLKIENLTKSLNESKKTSASSLSAYADLKAKTSGVDPKYLKESLGKDLSVDRINQLTESISDRDRRYKALPITNDPRLDGVSKVSVRTESLSQVDEETENTKTFLENYYKIKS